MADYFPLGPVQVTAVTDQTGLNAGNWTNHFPSSVLPTVGVYEVFHIVITSSSAHVLAGASIILAGKTWDTVTLDQNGSNSWDPSQPMEVRADQDVFFLWAIPVTSTPAPVVTLWPRYDTQLPVNAGG